MGKLKNDRLIKALLRQPVDQTPIWLMRQAGRYLPEYRAIRSSVPNFLTLCKTPELACEVTLQPLARFPLDAAIIFSDILTIPDAMGLNLYFSEGEGPRFEKTLELNDLKKLRSLDVSHDLKYTLDAIRLVSKELNGKVPLIGFVGSPWTLACYMLEGGASKTFSKARSFCYKAPKYLHDLLNFLSTSITEYLIAQVEAGVDVLMLFDTWGGLLTPENYLNFSLNYLKKIIYTLKNHPKTANIPIILFTKQGSNWLEAMTNSACDAIGLDWSININEARQRIGNKVAIQGNFDPALLLGTPDSIREAVKYLLAQYGSFPGHIANLGHGIEPSTPLENVRVLVDAVHEYSKIYHQLLSS